MGKAARRVIVLGSTGSIGTNAIEVIQHLAATTPVQCEVIALAAGSNAALLEQQARVLGVRHLAVADPRGASMLESAGSVRSGPTAAMQLLDDVARPGDLLIAAMVGFAGLETVLRGIELGCDVALANKETLVAAGELVTGLAKSKGVQIFPIDSEHSALAQCIRAGRLTEIDRVVITASGGPFRTWTPERTHNATVTEALRHPTWRMGRKVTIDSATLMNKALEIIEAHWLFDLPSQRIEAIVHPQSIVHGFVEYCDGSVVAQLSPPDMKLPIQMAITWPDRFPGVAKRLDWTLMKSLEFEQIDHARFPAVHFARSVIQRGGTSGAILNAANEAAVHAFLEGHIAFGTIGSLVGEALDHFPDHPLETLADAQDADAKARHFIAQRTRGLPLETR